MDKQTFEALLSGPQGLTQNALKDILEYVRTENNNVEFKQEFNRERDGSLVQIDFCKVIIGFLNSDLGGVVIYGIADDINENMGEEVSKFVVGHDMAKTRVEDLVGYLRLAVWPPEVGMIHFRQLPISNTRAVTTIYVGSGRSKPYLYYKPNDVESGIRSFSRASRVTYELGAPQLHSFFAVRSKGLAPPEQIPLRSRGTESGNVDSLLKENLEEALRIIKDPDKFGLITICVYPSSHVNVSDADIKNLVEPRARDVKRMEEIWYGQMEVSQKWYRRLFIPYQLAEERKCTWAITCYRRTGVLFVNSLVDEYMQGKRYLNPFYLAYQIQRLLQMAKELYAGQTDSIELVLDFKYLEAFGYLIVRFETIETIAPYIGFAGPIELEIGTTEIFTGEKADLTMPVVERCMGEVAKIFGQDRLPNSLSDSKGEMIFVEYFKGIR